MSFINTYIGTPLGWIMWLCYRLVGSYWIAILLFTLLSKVILLPLSIVVQKNSIKMIRLQPEINRITASHYGDKDTITDETMALYKREKYSPLLGMVPMIIHLQSDAASSASGSGSMRYFRFSYSYASGGR